MWRILDVGLDGKLWVTCWHEGYEIVCRYERTTVVRCANCGRSYQMPRGAEHAMPAAFDWLRCPFPAQIVDAQAAWS